METFFLGYLVGILTLIAIDVIRLFVRGCR
jgi:hypothetical protein